jgi:hypothetical protein
MYSKTFLEKLPIELLQEVIYQININDLYNFCTTSHTIRNTCLDKLQMLFKTHFLKIQSHITDKKILENITLETLSTLNNVFSNSAISKTFPDSVVPFLEYFDYNTSDKTSLLILIDIIINANENEYELIMESLPFIIKDYDTTCQDAITFVIYKLLSFFLSRWKRFISGESDMNNIYFENDGEYIGNILHEMIDKNYTQHNFLLIAKLIRKFDLSFVVSGPYEIFGQEDVLEYAFTKKYYKLFIVLYQNNNDLIVNKNYFINQVELAKKLNDGITLKLLEPFINENQHLFSV